MADSVLEAQKNYIRSILERLDMDATALAKAVKISPSTLNRPLNKKEWPHRISLRTLSKLAEYSRIPIPDDALGTSTASTTEPAPSPSGSGKVSLITDNVLDVADEKFPNEVRHPDVPIKSLDIYNWPRDLPVRGVASLGNGEGEFYFNGAQVAQVRRPPPLVGVKDAFAVYCEGTSMVPAIEPGDVVRINPHQPAKSGDYVLIELHPEKGEPVGAALVKLLVRTTADKVVLEQYRPPKQFTLSRKRVKHIYRIIMPREWED